MALTELNNDTFKKMIRLATKKLNDNAKFINSLNVFPVPDGDTGTNMSLSLASGYKYVSNETADSISSSAAALAKGLLMGARGNSGVILSQIFRGFSKSVEGDKDLDVKELSQAFNNSCQTAYSSVMKPTEGTILTVIHGAADEAKKAAAAGQDIPEFFDSIANAANAALQKTPEMLPVLKKVGVVDSGGQGLVFVLQSFADAVNNRSSVDDGELNVGQMNEMIDAEHHKSVQSEIDPNDIKYGYCTQIMVRIGKGKEVQHQFNYDEFYQYLAKLGDSLLVINDDEIVKVHVHTEHPGKVLSWGQEFGDLATVKVDNMRIQQADIIENDQHESQADQKDKYYNDTAIIAIANGHGIEKLFSSLGVTDFISGGQTMNPSTQNILDAINRSKASKAIVLPNNGNIFLAADQAAQVSEKSVKIVHTKSISQGMTAMLGYNPDASLDDNKAAMEESATTVKSGQVTKAVRDTKLDSVHIKKGQYIGIIDGQITVTSSNKIDAAINMLKMMLDEDSEAVTIIYGKDANERGAQKIKNQVLNIDSDLEVEVHEGDQPVYPFLISVE